MKKVLFTLITAVLVIAGNLSAWIVVNSRGEMAAKCKANTQWYGTGCPGWFCCDPAIITGNAGSGATVLPKGAITVKTCNELVKSIEAAKQNPKNQELNNQAKQMTADHGKNCTDLGKRLKEAK